MARGWGIVGTGRMARSFAAALRAEGDHVAAVASTSAPRARTLADELGAATATDDLEVLLRDPAVDVVYVATTNDRHHGDALAAIAAGRPVVVEKPLALDHRRGSEVVAAARQAGVFAMEAMWMRVQPAFEVALDRLARGDIGIPHLVQADFGIAGEHDPARRWFSRELGGGALLDLGIYPATLALAVLGRPTRVVASAVLADTGVDAQTAVILEHGTDARSSLTCSLLADSGVEATIAGTEGSIRIHGPFHHAPRVTVRRRDRVVDDIAVDGHELGLRHEVREVQRCLDAGRLESDRIRLDDSLAVLATLDAIRAEVGVSYDAPAG